MFTLIRSRKQLTQAAAELSRHHTLGYDTETTSLDPHSGKLRLLQLSTPTHAYVLDLFNFPVDEIGPFKELLADPRRVKVMHNAVYDVKWTRKHLGVEVAGIYDTMLASQVISAGDQTHRHNMGAVTKRYLGKEVDKTEQLSDWSGKLSESQLEYAAKDSLVLHELVDVLTRRLMLDDLLRCAFLEFESVPAVADVELSGFPIIKEIWAEQVRRVEVEHKRIHDEVVGLLASAVKSVDPQDMLFADAREVTININSKPQVRKALIAMGVLIEGTSVDQHVLKPLAKQFPVIAKLMEYNKIQKRLSSYGWKFLEQVNPVTGRLHSGINLIGAPTGRMGCHDPNIMQIPKDKEYRQAIQAPAGMVFVDADYSQIELRILADFSGEKKFLDAFINGVDLHADAARDLFDPNLDQLKETDKDKYDKLRSEAKNINFMIPYGGGAGRFASMSGRDIDECSVLLDKYFAERPRIKQWLDDAAWCASNERVIRTASGRLMRTFFDPDDKSAVGLAKRNGKNCPIQGTGADILKRSLALLYPALQQVNDAHIVNMVHDQNVVLCPEGEAERVGRIMNQTMCDAGAEFVKRVPIKVDVDVKKVWLK